MPTKVRKESDELSYAVLVTRYGPQSAASASGQRVRSSRCRKIDRSIDRVLDDERAYRQGDIHSRIHSGTRVQRTRNKKKKKKKKSNEGSIVGIKMGTGKDTRDVHATITFHRDCFHRYVWRRQEKERDEERERESTSTVEQGKNEGERDE